MCEFCSNEYHLSNAKWGTGEYGTPGGTVTWGFATTPGTGFGFSSYITDPAYRDAIRDAFQAWEDVANIDFVEVTAGADTDIQLGWDTIDGPFSVVGEAATAGSKSTSTLFSFTEAEIRFDVDEKWTTDHDVGRSEVGFYQVALHEIGHAIGLNHTTDENTIMYSSDISDLAGLTAGDIAGAQAFYGAAQASSDPGPEPAPEPSPGDVSPYVATVGDDSFIARSGDDVINGLGGNDTVSYAGTEGSYTVAFARSGITITDRVSGRDGVDTLIDIEQLQFDGSSFDIGIRSGATDLTAEQFTAISELYTAYFNRAPAAKGILYWGTRLEDGMTLPEIAESFFVQPETQNTYARFLNADGSLNNTQGFVNTVFNNVLGRDPSSTYWVEQLEDASTGVTPAKFILAVLNGAKAETGGAADAAYLSSKADIGVYFSAIKGLSEYDDTVAVMSSLSRAEDNVASVIQMIDTLHTEALDPASGALLLPLVGVIDDPFAGM